MAIKVLQGKRIAPEMPKTSQSFEEEPKQFIQQTRPESILDTLGRVGTATGLGALRNLEGLANLATLPIQAVAGFPKLSPFSEQIEREFGITPGQQEPQNLAERFIQRFGSQLPLAAIGGLPGIAQSAIGSGAGALAGEAGLPEGVQDLAQLGAGIGSGLFKGKIPTLRSSQKQQYQLARAAVKPETRAAAQPVINAMQHVEQQLGTEVNESVGNKVRHALKIIDQNLSKEKISPLTAMDLRRNLYKLGNSFSDADAKSYIEPLTKGVNEFFTNYAVENPKFFNHLSRADKLTQLKNMTSIFEKAGNLFGKIPGVSGPVIKNVIKYTLGKSVGKGEKLFRALLTGEGWRHYLNAGKATIENDPAFFLKSLANLRKSLPSEIADDLFEEQGNTIKEAPNKGIKILQGKKL